MTREGWDQEWMRVYDSCMHEKREPSWAFRRAHEIMNKAFGPRPDKDQIPTPGLIAWNKLGWQLRSFRMQAHTNVGAWIAALGAAFTTAGAQYAVANSDLVVNGGEWAGIAIQFISVLLATLANPSKKEAPKE